MKLVRVRCAFGPHKSLTADREIGALADDPKLWVIPSPEVLSVEEDPNLCAREFALMCEDTDESHMKQRLAEFYVRPFILGCAATEISNVPDNDELAQAVRAGRF